MALAIIQKILPATDPPNEKELINRIAAGDEKAFSLFVAPVFDRLFGFAFSVTKSAELAEEVVQDALLRIWQHREELPAIENLTAWTHTITRNLAYNALRRQLRDHQLVKNLDQYFSLTDITAEDKLVLNDAMKLVQQAASTLPPQQALVFTMNRLQGQTLDEIAHQLGISKATVKKHLAQALKAVRLYIQTHSAEILLLVLGCSDLLQ